MKIPVLGAAGRKLKAIEPAHMMLLGVALVVALVFSFKYISAPDTHINIVYDDLPESSPIVQKRKVKESVQMGETDDNMRLSARVFEANGIANGILHFCLYQYFVLNKGVPANGSDLLTAFQSSDLKPPFVQKITANGQLLTARGAYFVYYNARPLTISILASGEDFRRDGSIFMLRAPDDAASIEASKQSLLSAVGATLYVAPSRIDAFVPPPFALPQDFTRAGWTIEPLRLTDVSSQKLSSINRMLDEQSK